MATILKAEQYIKVTPSEVYFAFTHAISLTEWMCDFATVAPQPGGRMYLWWYGNFILPENSFLWKKTNPSNLNGIPARTRLPAR